MKNQSEQVAEILLSIQAVTLNAHKPFRYSSGILSPIYTDCRLVISSPKERRKIIDLLVRLIKENDPIFDLVAGTATAGIPHAAWISEKLKLPMVYVRGKPKDHGKGNQIEGRVLSKQKSIVVEDLISTGSSSIESAEALRKSGIKVKSIFSIMTYDMDEAKNSFKDHKLKSYSLTNFEVIVKVAKDKSLIKEKDIDMILQWSKDPAVWGKKMGFE